MSHCVNMFLFEIENENCTELWLIGLVWFVRKGSQRLWTFLPLCTMLLPWTFLFTRSFKIRGSFIFYRIFKKRVCNMMDTLSKKNKEDTFTILEVWRQFGKFKPSQFSLRMSSSCMMWLLIPPLSLGWTKSGTTDWFQTGSDL